MNADFLATCRRVRDAWIVRARGLRGIDCKRARRAIREARHANTMLVRALRTDRIMNIIGSK